MSALHYPGADEMIRVILEHPAFAKCRRVKCQEKTIQIARPRPSDQSLLPENAQRNGAVEGFYFWDEASEDARVSVYEVNLQRFDGDGETLDEALYEAAEAVWEWAHMRRIEMVPSTFLVVERAVTAVRKADSVAVTVWATVQRCP